MVEAKNQPPPFEDVNLFASDCALREAVTREGGSAHAERIDQFGARMGAAENSVTVVRTPGAWEIPLALRDLAKTGRFDALVALGAVLRGGTPHFEYVAGAVSKGVAAVSLERPL